MKYVHFTTRSLSSLVDGYKGGSFPWSQIGTSAKAINLDKIDGGNMAINPEDGISYLLPIVDEEVTKTFIEKNLNPYNIKAEIISEEEALAQWEKYKANKIKE